MLLLMMSTMLIMVILNVGDGVDVEVDDVDDGDVADADVADNDDAEDYVADADDEVVVPIPDSEIIARILSHVRQKITLEVTSHDSVWHAEESRSFARAIHGHPYITHFCDRGMFPYQSLDTLFSTLTTLPALESVSFRAPE